MPISFGNIDTVQPIPTNFELSVFAAYCPYFLSDAYPSMQGFSDTKCAVKFNLPKKTWCQKQNSLRISENEFFFTVLVRKQLLLFTNGLNHSIEIVKLIFFSMFFSRRNYGFTNFYSVKMQAAMSFVMAARMPSSLLHGQSQNNGCCSSQSGSVSLFPNANKRSNSFSCVSSEVD